MAPERTKKLNGKVGVRKSQRLATMVPKPAEPSVGQSATRKRANKRAAGNTDDDDSMDESLADLRRKYVRHDTTSPVTNSRNSAPAVSPPRSSSTANSDRPMNREESTTNAGPVLALRRSRRSRRRRRSSTIEYEVIQRPRFVQPVTITISDSEDDDSVEDPLTPYHRSIVMSDITIMALDPPDPYSTATSQHWGDLIGTSYSPRPIFPSESNGDDDNDVIPLENEPPPPAPRTRRSLRSNAGQRTGNHSGMVAFHRRPVTSSNGTQTDTDAENVLSLVGQRRPMVASRRLRDSRTRDELSEIVRFMRMRDSIIQRTVDLGSLDSILLDLEQALGVSLSDEEINNLPTSVVSLSEAGTSSPSICTICMDEFGEGDVKRHLPCLHAYHKNCVDTWLKQKSTCPVCRVDARTSARP